MHCSASSAPWERPRWCRPTILPRGGSSAIWALSPFPRWASAIAGTGGGFQPQQFFSASCGWWSGSGSSSRWGTSRPSPLSGASLRVRPCCLPTGRSSGAAGGRCKPHRPHGGPRCLDKPCRGTASLFLLALRSEFSPAAHWAILAAAVAAAAISRFMPRFDLVLAVTCAIVIVAFGLNYVDGIALDNLAERALGWPPTDTLFGRAVPRLPPACPPGRNRNIRGRIAALRTSAAAQEDCRGDGGRSGFPAGRGICGVSQCQRR